MATFLMSLVSPEKLLLAEQVDQCDLPGVEGEFGVLAGHAPIIASLRPGIVTAIAGGDRQGFVVLGGVAEFADEQLTILAETASAVEDFDLNEFRSRIEDMQQELSGRSVGEELDRTIVLLDHYRSILVTLNPTTAF